MWQSRQIAQALRGPQQQMNVGGGMPRPALSPQEAPAMNLDPTGGVSPAMLKGAEAAGNWAKDNYFKPDAAQPMDISSPPQVAADPFGTGASAPVGDPFKEAESTDRGFGGMFKDALGAVSPAMMGINALKGGAWKDVAPYVSPSVAAFKGLKGLF